MNKVSNPFRGLAQSLSSIPKLRKRDCGDASGLVDAICFIGAGHAKALEPMWYKVIGSSLVPPLLSMSFVG